MRSLAFQLFSDGQILGEGRKVEQKLQSLSAMDRYGSALVELCLGSLGEMLVSPTWSQKHLIETIMATWVTCQWCDVYFVTSLIRALYFSRIAALPKPKWI